MPKKDSSADAAKSTEIEHFVKNTLSSVFQAIDDLTYMDMSGGPLKIQSVHPLGGRPKPIGNRYKFEMPDSVAFAIAVTVSESSSINGGLDLKVAKIGSDVGGQQSTVSRVNFAIPILKNLDDD